MMTFAFFLLGGFAGIFAWLYIDHFIPNLQQEIYQNYIELYPENRPIFHSEKAAIQSQKCGHIFLYFLGFGLCFAALYYFLQDELFTLWLAITLSHLSKWFYKKEALGRGDYWLALGIGTYLTIAHLPLFLFIACLLGIIGYWISRKPVLPFAPFLCLSLIITSAITL